MVSAQDLSVHRDFVRRILGFGGIPDLGLVLQVAT
jgi:hypothetical protein